MKKNFFKAGAIILSVVAITACGTKKSVVGEWIEPVNGMEGMVQGFNLEEGGKASSINMATLVYESWEQQGDKLILAGQSIGNGQTISFSDTMEIAKHTADSLVLKSKGMEMAYARQK